MSHDLRGTIAAHPFTAGFAPAHLDLIARLAAEHHVPAGTFLFHVGDDARALHLITAGHLAVEIVDPGREPLVVTTLHSGDIAGWSWYVPPHRSAFDVLAVDPVTVVSVDGPALRQACEQDHELGYVVGRRLASVLAARLAATRLQLMDVYGRAR